MHSAYTERTPHVHTMGENGGVNAACVPLS
jgi:hypothetical protein